MLRIEKVFLQGFKSFCDPTEVVFDAEGITAVVGPNGCGKSNVADALSWVIGEQRAKALRGAKMEDVIFQGSRNRPPSGLAEVVLTLRVFTSFELPSTENEVQEAVTEAQPTEHVEPLSANAAPASSSHFPARARVATSIKSFAEGEKITVARRLYRTGASEYEMNGRACRLRDIQDLFAGTGLGGAHYAIIEQGRIGQVLSARPLDRRALIEEAAGISKFKMRQRAAELKLEAAKQNLSRVTDILLEVERQQNALKRQAAKARRYQRLRQEMRALTKAVIVSDYRLIQNALRELETERQEIGKLEAQWLQQLKQAEEARQTIIAQANQLDVELTHARAEAASTHLQIEKTRQQQVYLQEQINLLTQRTQQSAQEQITISERRRLLVQEGERLRAELQTIEVAINLEASSLSQAEKSHAAQSTQDNLAENQLEAARQRVTEAATHRERWKQLMRQFQEALERNQKTLAGLAAEQTRAQEQSQRNESERQEVLARLSQTEQEQLALLTHLAQSKESLVLAQSQSKEIERGLSELQKQALIIEQRLKSLIELDEQRAYFSEAVQSVIQESKKREIGIKFNIIGTLADFIKAPSEVEAMVEVGLREELQYLLTPSFEDALSAIDFLKREQRGRATFLVLNTVPGKVPAPEIINGNQIVRLIDLLGLKPDLRAVIQQALPRLTQTVVTDQLQQAIQDSISTNGKGHSFLTSAGEFVSAGHLISGGSVTTQGRGVLALKREIEELQTQFQRFSEQIIVTDEQHNQCQAAVARLTEQYHELDSQQREQEKEFLLQRGLLQQCEREQERATTHLRVVEAEITQANLEQSEVQEKLHLAQQEWQEAEKALKEAEKQAEAATITLASIRQKATERTQELSSRRADFAAKSERRKGLLNDIRRLESEIEELNRRLSRSQMEAVETEERDRSFRTTGTEIEEELAILTAAYQTQTHQVENLSAAVSSEKDKLARLEVEITQGREELTIQREKRAECDIARTKFEASQEHLAAVCYSELGEQLAALLHNYDQAHTEIRQNAAATKQERVSPIEEDDEVDDFEPAPSSTLTPFSEDFDLEKAKARLDELRAKVEGIGPVNLLALEELGELAERLAFLRSQKIDIEQAVADTLAVIAELKKRSRDRFLEAFQQINHNFSEMFLELFGGGHGEMRLIDESDVLESGIDIIAQPPGKRLQNVLLLSGGEKAMAALALVMGIFKYRPSPFCLLDEVDAPLDDVNIGRFSDKILAMSQHTQFVVITHSKRTMEAARTLYGVTMQDPGVSKLISVRLT